MAKQEFSSWQDVRDEVLRRITERIWEPGENIPNEVDLAKEFGCARATVNRALQVVADAGLLERRRKAGTRVSINPVRKATLDIPITRMEVESRGNEYSHKILERDLLTMPKTLADELGLPNDKVFLKINSLHSADKKPFLYEERWLNHENMPQILDVDFNTTSVNEWLVQNVLFSEGDIAFCATTANGKISKALDVEDGAAIFNVDRVTWQGDQLITAVKLYYAPGFKMHTKL